MDLKRLFNKGKRLVDERGGVDSLKEDAQEVAGIAKGGGSLTDKAKQAADAVKEPGSNEGAAADRGASEAPAAGRPGKGQGEHGGASPGR